MDKTQGHKIDQPRHRGHSHDPENDLLKRFVVAKQVKHGWLWLKSFDSYDEAGVYAWTLPLDVEFKLIDQQRQN